jgi:hypothetical protein
MEFRLVPRITRHSAEQRGGGDHGFGAAHETCLRHSDGLRTRYTTGINPGVTRSIAPLALMVPVSHTMYLVTMLCSFNPPPSPPSGAKERRMEGSSLLKFLSGINAPL